MNVKTLWLRGFRNYEELACDFDPGVNVLIGANAQGKTNLLEAVEYCAIGRSHRTAFDKECISFKQTDAYIKTSYDVPERPSASGHVEIQLHKNGKKSVIVDGTPARRINDLFGHLLVVLFSPEDLALVKEGPGKRRRFMDTEICQVDPIYLHHLQNYQIVLRQRNQFLKDRASGADLSLLDIYDEQLAEEAGWIIRRRKEFIAALSEAAPKIHDTITSGTEKIRFRYDKSVDGAKEEIFERMRAARKNDFNYGSTTVGPHHDDIAIFVDQNDVRKYGSQGQKRTTALSMKLAEVHMIEKETGLKPVLLLDDVMSELDEHRQQMLIESMQGHQTILTCTGVEDSIKKMEDVRTLHIREGKITE